MSVEGDFVVGDAGGTVHIVNIGTDSLAVNTIENAHNVRCLPVPNAT